MKVTPGTPKATTQIDTKPTVEAKPLEVVKPAPTTARDESTAPAKTFGTLSFQSTAPATLPTADLYGTEKKSKERTQQSKGYPPRMQVPDDKVSWNVPLESYKPPAYTAPSVFKNDVTKDPKGWADPDSTTAAAKLHSLTQGAGPVKMAISQSLIDRETGKPMEVPLNPAGRTGIEGRGLLGKWGANFAADAMLTRVTKDGELQLFVIQRGDTGEWALPGGMAEPGENAAQTAARELHEEAGVQLDLGPGAARVIYSGHVDDPRNTDNAWMETTVEHKHLPADVTAQLKFKAGDDAVGTWWMPVTKENVASLYASHGNFVRDALKGWSEPGLEKQIAAALG
jgi:ADP-ribose pyrophosphatase